MKSHPRPQEAWSLSPTGEMMQFDSARVKDGSNPSPAVLAPRRETFKDSYPFRCAACGYEQCAKPSIMMPGFGMNSGHGSCLNCGTFLHLEIEGGLDGEFMVSEVWDDFLKRTKEHEAQAVKP